MYALLSIQISGMDLISMDLLLHWLIDFVFFCSIHGIYRQVILIYLTYFLIYASDEIRFQVKFLHRLDEIH